MRCRSLAVAVAEVDVKAATVRLVANGDRFSGLALCQRHADALTAPLGWELIDTRDRQLALFDDRRLRQDRPPKKKKQKPKSAATRAVEPEDGQLPMPTTGLLGRAFRTGGV